jgi:DNA invertase Pin-like site-specific DNA recombinase
MNRVNTYPEVKELPSNAMSVCEYATYKGISTQAIYNQIRKQKNNGYYIVVFKGFNFVIFS